MKINTIIHDNEVIIGLYRYSQEEKKQSRSAYALKDSIDIQYKTRIMFDTCMYSNYTTCTAF